MRKLVLWTVALLLVMMPASAMAGSYVFSAWGGWQFQNEDAIDDAWKVGAEVEYRMGVTAMPLEVGLALPFEYMAADNAGFDIDQYTFIPTVKAYLTAIPIITPYVGGGVGYARTDIDRPGVDSQDSLALKAVAGAELHLIPASPFYLFGEWEYNWIEVDDGVIIGAGDSPDVGGNAVQGGARFRF
jgi:opacity protein-like surface antigen